MIVQVDITAGQATLEQPEDCKKFHVAAPAGTELGQIAEMLGTEDDAPADHVWVPVDWVRQQASGRVSDGWAGEFDGMLGYASSKGWMSPDGASVQAHVEWE
jgi:hypothetical protein